MASTLATDATWTPKSNPEVARVMEERGVGVKRAYQIIKDQRSAQFKSVEVPQTQRAQVLVCLVEHAGSAKNAAVLLEALHADGVRIDMHDTVKTLWSLQKNRFVSFRERGNPPSLYAIVVTEAGLAAYEGMKRKAAEAEPTVATAEEVAPIVELPSQSVPDEEYVRASPEDIIEEALAARRVDLTRYPLISDIRERARKQTRLAEAARILEDAGEDDLALTIMSKTEFSPLELEVRDLLAVLGEV